MVLSDSLTMDLLDVHINCFGWGIIAVMTIYGAAVIVAKPLGNLTLEASRI